MNNRRSRLSCLSFASALLALLLIFFLLVPTAMAAPSTRENRNTRFGGVYRRPLRGDPSSLDPARATDIYANTVVNQSFDGLVQFDRHLNPIPAIAGFWEASSDGLTWVFYLRKGVKFHHGRYLQRIEIFREVEKLAVHDAPWISQHHRVFEYLYQPHVRGVEISALGAHYIPMINIWLQEAPEGRRA